MASLTGAKASQGITIRMSLFSIKGKVYNVVNTALEKETKMFMVCPSCSAARVNQVYCCADGCVPSDAVPSANEYGWVTGEITSRGREVDGEVVIMTEQEIAEAKAPALESGLMDLELCPAEQVDANSVATGTVYYFDPETADPLFALLMDRVADRTVAFVGNLTMRSNVKFYRLDMHFDGGLLLREMVRPEAMHRFEELALPVPMANDAALFSTVCDAMLTDFVPEDHDSERIKNLTVLIQSKSGSDAVVTPITKGKKTEVKTTLTQQLEAALALIAAKKTA